MLWDVWLDASITFGLCNGRMSSATSLNCPRIIWKLHDLNSGSTLTYSRALRSETLQNHRGNSITVPVTINSPPHTLGSKSVETIFIQFLTWCKESVRFHSELYSIKYSWSFLTVKKKKIVFCVFWEFIPRALNFSWMLHNYFQVISDYSGNF